jgi:hypothetical protein
MKRTGLTLALIALVVSTAWARINVVSGLVQETSLQAGETYRGSIEIKNSGDTVEDVIVYQTDYRFTFDGQNHYGDPAENPRSNAAWLTFSPRQLTIQPGATGTVYYTITVPNDAALSGTYWSMLMVEEAPTSRSEQKENGIFVQMKMRYGVQIITHMGTSGRRDVEFLDARLLQEQDKQVFQLDVRNAGDRSFRPDIQTQIFGTDGDRVVTLQSESKRLLPETSARYRFDLSKLNPDDYEALVIVDCGDADVFGARYSLIMEP